jgi:hypothetical protein
VLRAPRRAPERNEPVVRIPLRRVALRPVPVRRVPVPVRRLPVLRVPVRRVVVRVAPDVQREVFRPVGRAVVVRVALRAVGDALRVPFRADVLRVVLAAFEREPLAVLRLNRGMGRTPKRPVGTNSACAAPITLPPYIGASSPNIHGRLPRKRRKRLHWSDKSPIPSPFLRCCVAAGPPADPRDPERAPRRSRDDLDSDSAGRSRAIQANSTGGGISREDRPIIGSRNGGRPGRARVFTRSSW